MAYWIENPDWHTGNSFADTALKAVRALPFKVHEPLKRSFYNTDNLIAVNGESVVVARGPNEVNKFMFRYPGKMATEAFFDHVRDEVGVVTEHLAGVALPTMVSIRSADIFKNPEARVDTVTQTQRKIDLDINGPLDLDLLNKARREPLIDRTARDLEILVTGTERLVSEHGFYPDAAHGGGNVRVNSINGAVTLIDVMPFYANGSRLIGDRPPNVIPHLQSNIAAYEEFVGQYGG
jgi:hypothetical protein